MKAAAISATAYLNLNLNYENLLFSSAKVLKINDIRKKNLGKNLGKMDWINEKIEYALTYSAPKGFGVNGNKLRGISKALVRSGGICPCAHDEWNESTPTEDKCCPCKTFRESGDCHCGLYIKL